MLLALLNISSSLSHYEDPYEVSLTHIITSPYKNSWLVDLAGCVWFPATKCCVRKLEFPCCFYNISFHNFTHPPFHSNPFKVFPYPIRCSAFIPLVYHTNY